MNELTFDYSKTNQLSVRRRRLLLIFGILFFGGSLLLLIFDIINQTNLSFFIVAVANMLVGISFILQSTEHRLLYPKKYIQIGPKGLQFKLGALHKEISLDWDQVKGIRSTRKSLSFVLEKDQPVTLRMIHFPSSDEKRIRATIHTISKSKNINLE